MKFADASRAIFSWKSSSLNIRSPSLLAIRRFETCAATTTNCIAAALTEEELNQLNDVVPRLCSSNHLKEAVQLISAALSTADPPPLGSLPLSVLINRIALEPDLTHSMHLLNSLKYNSTAEKTLIVAKMCVKHFFRNGHPKKAAKVFQWMCRPDFPGGLPDDSEFCAVLVDGFCRHGLILDALGVLRAMASANFVIGSDVRRLVYRGLLREARVKEALELNAALDCCCTLGLSDGATMTMSTKEVLDLLDRMAADWVD